jgi:NAD(P)-dependent dehydrogenase (short-subunit alcohol dehydrogenase family)
MAAIPFGRMGSPSDIAAPMLFLSGDASRYMTGQILHVNGGRLMP